MATSFDQKSLQAITDAVGLQATPVTIADGVKSASEGNAVATSLAALNTLETFASVAGKSLKGSSGALAAASVAYNVNAAKDDIDKYGTIQDSTALSLGGDAAALAGLVGAAVVGGAAGAGLLAVGVVAAAAFGVAALTQAEGDTGIATDVSNMATDLLADVQGLVEQAGNDLQRVFDSVAGTFEESVENVADMAAEVGGAIDSGHNSAVLLFTDFLEWWDPAGIMPESNSPYLSAHEWAPRRDPLTLDLDGDGLETVGIDTARPVHFDHNVDGVKTATGWVAPDDGFLVLDRNGNGLVDSGAELFGDSTVLADGSNAADGFAALAEQDTNPSGAGSDLANLLYMLA